VGLEEGVECFCGRKEKRFTALEKGGGGKLRKFRLGEEKGAPSEKGKAPSSVPNGGGKTLNETEEKKKGGKESLRFQRSLGAANHLRGGKESSSGKEERRFC